MERYINNFVPPKKVVPGHDTYASTLKHKNKSFVIGDSHLRRMNKRIFNKCSNSTYVKPFLGVNTKELDHHIIPTLVDQKPSSIIIHIGSNDITKSNYKYVNVKEVAERISSIGLKCRRYGVNDIAISSILVRNHSIINNLIIETNFYLKELCLRNGFRFISNDNISNNLLYKDGLHLSDKGTTVLANSFLQYFSSLSSDERLRNVNMNYLD